MKPTAKFQIGKQGLTLGIIEKIRTGFSGRNNIKVHVLKSAGHDKSQVKELGEKIVDKLGRNFTSKTLGFTIFLKKWRKDKR